MSFRSFSLKVVLWVVYFDGQSLQRNTVEKPHNRHTQLTTAPTGLEKFGGESVTSTFHLCGVTLNLPLVWCYPREDLFLL